MDKPANLSEAIEYYADLDVATSYVAGLRWPDGFVCPHCGGIEYSYVSTRRLWKCKSCKKQSSVKVGTIFEDSALGLDKWLPAIWLAANPESGTSSHELARALGTTQKSAWLMLQRIGEAEATWATPVVPSEPPAEEPGEVGRAEPPAMGFVPGWVLLLAVLGSFGLGVVVGRLGSRRDRRR